MTAVPFLTMVQNCAGIEAEWGYDFLAWYKPEEWLNEERAVAAFLGQKIHEIKKGLK